MRPAPTAAIAAAPSTAASVTAGATTADTEDVALDLRPQRTQRGAAGEPKFGQRGRRIAEGDRTSRSANAPPSRTARTRWARLWQARRPQNTPRASASQIGDRSPARYGRNTRPSGPGGTSSASRRSSSIVQRSPRTPSASQSATTRSPSSRRPASSGRDRGTARSTCPEGTGFRGEDRNAARRAADVDGLPDSSAPAPTIVAAPSFVPATTRRRRECRVRARCCRDPAYPLPAPPPRQGVARRSSAGRQRRLPRLQARLRNAREPERNPVPLFSSHLGPARSPARAARASGSRAGA